MDVAEIYTGLRVKVVRLRKTTGMLIASKHLNVRAAGKTGTVRGWVPGHGGDVWFVQHDNSDEIGAYSFTELKKA